MDKAYGKHKTQHRWLLAFPQRFVTRLLVQPHMWIGFTRPHSTLMKTECEQRQMTQTVFAQCGSTSETMLACATQQT